MGGVGGSVGRLSGYVCKSAVEAHRRMVCSEWMRAGMLYTCVLMDTLRRQTLELSNWVRGIFIGIHPYSYPSIHTGSGAVSRRLVSLHQLVGPALPDYMYNTNTFVIQVGCLPHNAPPLSHPPKPRPPQCTPTKHRPHILPSPLSAFGDGLKCGFNRRCLPLSRC